ncbi:MAG: zinc-binding dehydrogenase [Burkholderiaceae bacterium]
MKALVYKAKNAPLAYEDIDLPALCAGEVRVELKAAALNHRDNWITKGLYPGIRENIILGSDGAGVLEGREVILNPNIGWGENQRFPAPDYHMLGMPTHGTFAQAIHVARDRVHDKPAHLSIEQAALPLPADRLRTVLSLPPAGRREGADQRRRWGVAFVRPPVATAAGAEVHVTSGSAEKIERAKALGAAGGANYRDDGWARSLKAASGGFDVIIDSAGGPGFADLVRLTRRGARIGLYGGTLGNWQNVSPQTVFFNQIDILGSTMGSDQDFTEMLAFVNQHRIEPVVDRRYALADGNQALAQMDAGSQFGKIVLTI